jgi:hypothetical protein
LVNICISRHTLLVDTEFSRGGEIRFRPKIVNQKRQQYFAAQPRYNIFFFPVWQIAQAKYVF